MEIVLSVVLVVAVALFVAAPLRRAFASDDAASGRRDDRIAELEARKEAKYREIRDAQMDRGAGKLADEDFARVDSELRREAVAILRELDELQGGG